MESFTNICLLNDRKVWRQGLSTPEYVSFAYVLLEIVDASDINAIPHLIGCRHDPISSVSGCEPCICYTRPSALNVTIYP